MIVAKAVNMANMMNIPVLGVVENMSYLECPDCGKRIEVFGHSKLDEVAAEKGLDILARLPINPQFASLCDAGRIEDFEGEWILSRKMENGEICYYHTSVQAASSV